MASNSDQWGCCSNEIEPSGSRYLKCDTCTKLYHYACLSIKESPKKSGSRKSWKCPTCVSSTPRISRSDSTPIKSVSTIRANKRQATEALSPVLPEFNKDDIRSIIQEIIKQELRDMLKQINLNITNTIYRELAPIKEEIQELKKSMDFINDSFEDIKKEQNQSRENMIKMNIEVQGRLNSLEQQSRMCNLEIQCVPENKRENLFSIVTQLGRVVNCNIKEQDIMHCSRIAKANTTRARPRSIVAQLATPRIRDHMLASVNKYNKNNPQNKLNCSHLGFAGEKFPVYVAEHLSPANRALHAATRIKAKEMNYKYVWIRNGKIFVRKTEGSDYILIRSVNGLEKII
ncbi:unnamed protein product [Spodoptera littoralis]|uniref:PHD-type domain-containing protein n=1 Tax=Spodoptera littoralis TaxID=7109 RepID=A0A9P0IKP1_SPOLI|nr:unnamed protein product [Spodoptera littoralis]CAH1646776.1 unnamed protein product [Spodoptera littoralis]